MQTITWDNTCAGQQPVEVSRDSDQSYPVSVSQDGYALTVNHPEYSGSIPYAYYDQYIYSRQDGGWIQISLTREVNAAYFNIFLPCGSQSQSS